MKIKNAAIMLTAVLARQGIYAPAKNLTTFFYVQKKR